MTTKTKYLLLALAALVQMPIWLNTGCANRGIGPQGGPKDTVPPVIVKRNVPQGARNVTTKEQTIQFNEFIVIDGSTDNILVSPPQQRAPEIKAVGKKLEIKFQEDLQDSTTYTIAFGNQLVDNNEHNPYRDFSICFSTSDQLDSLEIYGQLVNAADLNPVSGIVVGIHRILDDSVFYNQPFTRIARTNEQGEFTIRNVKQGTYRLYALQDQSRDYCFQSGEALAFCDTTITPYITSEIFLDTIYLQDTLSADSLPIPDSVITREYFYYEPSNLVLRLFQEDYQRLYFKRAIRKDAHLIQLYFNGPQPEVPVFEGLPEHHLIQYTATMDTFQIWLTDSSAIAIDSLRYAITYIKTDSLFNQIPQTDTLLSVYHAPRINERTRQAIEQKRIKTGLVIKSNATSNFNFFDTLILRSPTPLLDYCIDSIHLSLKEDTVMTPIPFFVQKKDSIGMTLAVLAQLKTSKDYVLNIDSGAMHDIYHLSNNADQYSLHVRSEEDYANITIYLHPYHEHAYIQLLNPTDQPVYTSKAIEQGTVFQHIEPGTYYLRMFIDDNNDGLWTTGEFKTHRQPEQVYYFQKKLNLRANWTFEQHFDWQLIPQLQQKPADIRHDATQKK